MKPTIVSWALIAFFIGSLSAGEGEDIINIVAGGENPGFSGDLGQAVEAYLQEPSGIAIDSDGNIYFADTGNHRVRRIGTDGIITTIAGNGTAGFSGDGGLAIQAEIHTPKGLDADGVGNIYIADSENNRIRKVTLDGIITTFAGSGETGYEGGGFGGDGGLATEARLHNPFDVAVDAVGNIYIADRLNHRIRRVGTDGMISTFAGTGAEDESPGSGFIDRGTFSGDNGPAIQAGLDRPSGVAVDMTGSVYIADNQYHRVRKVDSNGIITTFAGIGGRHPNYENFGSPSGDGGPASEAGLASPTTIAIDPEGNVYIGGIYYLRRVDPNGIITTVAGAPGRDWRLPTNGYPAVLTLVSAQLRGVRGVAVDAQGDVYLSAFNQILRIGIDEPGIVVPDSALVFDDINAGTQGQVSFIVNNYGRRMLHIADMRFEGTDKDAFSVPTTEVMVPAGDSLTVDVMFTPTSAGEKTAVLAIEHNAYSGSQTLSFIGRAAPAGTPYIATFAGTGKSGSFGDLELATQAQLSGPVDVTLDAVGNVYIADSFNRRIRKVDSNGIMTTFAGGRSDVPDFGDGGPGVRAELQRPTGIAIDGAGNVYIADMYQHRVRKVDPQGTITTIAGLAAGRSDGHFSGDGGLATQAELDTPTGVAADGTGAVYIADSRNHRIRKVDTTGVITTIAGIGAVGSLGGGFEGDGGPATQARLKFPTKVAVDAPGNIYIVDSGNFRVRKISTDGIITTVAGNGEQEFAGEGALATQTGLDLEDIAVDRAGNLYLVANEKVLTLDMEGRLQTIAGTGESGYAGDGGPAIFAQFINVAGVAIGPDGRVYIADSGNNRIRATEPIEIPEPNIPPAVVNALTEITLTAQGSQYSTPLEPNPPIFQDAEGDLLTFTASSTDEGVAWASVDVVDGEKRLVVVPGNPGSATVTVVADDGKGGTASTSFVVAIMEAVVGDFTGDGEVNFPDFLMFARGFGKSQGEPEFDSKLDLNGNGSVDFPDFLEFAKAFGK